MIFKKLCILINLIILFLFYIYRFLKITIVILICLIIKLWIIVYPSICVTQINKFKNLYRKREIFISSFLEKQSFLEFIN
jgi:hypothetical protein